MISYGIGFACSVLVVGIISFFYKGAINQKRFERLDSQLQSMDIIFEQFAQQHRIKWIKNEKEWPSRSLKWEENEINFLIQIYTADSKRETFNMWICASQLRDGKTYWKQSYLKENIALEFLKHDLDSLLSRGFMQLKKIQRTDLALPNVFE